MIKISSINGKKLINPLDSAIKNLQLGIDVCYLDHFGQVYQKFGLINMVSERKMWSGLTGRIGLVHNAFVQKGQDLLAQT